MNNWGLLTYSYVILPSSLFFFNSLEFVWLTCLWLSDGNAWIQMTGTLVIWLIPRTHDEKFWCTICFAANCCAVLQQCAMGWNVWSCNTLNPRVACILVKWSHYCCRNICLVSLDLIYWKMNSERVGVMVTLRQYLQLLTDFLPEGRCKVTLSLLAYLWMRKGTFSNS